jgi:hypothetical protein
MPGTLFDVFGSFEVPEGADVLTFEKRRDEFYRLIGKCIKEWAHVENELFEICVLALKAPRRQAAIIYYRSPSIDTRLRLANELLQASLPPPERPKEDGGHDHSLLIQWKKINGDISDLLPTRNQLAHAPVRQVTSDAQLPLAQGARVVTFLPTWLEVATSANEELRGGAKKEPVREDKLPDQLKKIEDISVGLSAFRKQLEAQLSASA